MFRKIDKKEVKVLLVIFGLLIIFFAVASYVPTTGKATVQDNSKIGNPNYCGIIENERCSENIGVEACMLLLSNVDGSLQEANTRGCVEVWIENNPEREDQIKYLKECAVERKSEEISQEDFDYCLEKWDEELEFNPSNPLLGYYFPSNNKEELNLFTDKNELYIYNPLEFKWFDVSRESFVGDEFDSSKKVWIDSETGREGVLPENFQVITGYYFPSSNGGRVNLFGTISNDLHLMIYNPNNEMWFDRTESEITGDEEKLPNVGKPILGYYFPSENGGRINLFWNDGRLFVFNPGSNRWFDRTENVLSGEEGQLPRNFDPKSGFYSPLQGGKVRLFSEDRYYVYYVSQGVWVDETLSLRNIGLPTDKFPKTGYYEYFETKDVLWYEYDEVYLAGNDGFFVRDFEYMAGGQLPQNEFYLTCDENDLTNEQRDLLELYDESVSDPEFVEHLPEFLENFYWIDIEEIRTCDKIFIMKLLEDFTDALGAGVY